MNLPLSGHIFQLFIAFHSRLWIVNAFNQNFHQLLIDVASTSSSRGWNYLISWSRPDRRRWILAVTLNERTHPASVGSAPEVCPWHACGISCGFCQCLCLVDSKHCGQPLEKLTKARRPFPAHNRLWEKSNSNIGGCGNLSNRKKKHRPAVDWLVS